MTAATELAREIIEALWHAPLKPETIEPIIAAKLAGQWISVGDRLPETNRRVIAGRAGTDASGEAFYGAQYGATRWWWVDSDAAGDYREAGFISHWQPLPAPPVPVAEAEKQS